MKTLENYDLPTNIVSQLARQDIFIAIAFVSPRSPQWEKVNYMMKSADTYTATDDTTYATFEKNARSIELAYAILSIGIKWKSCYFFVEGVPVFSTRDVKWLECYMRSLRARDLRAYCTRVDRVPYYTKLGKYEIDLFLSPCQYILHGWWFSPHHPSDYADQFQAQAVRKGVDQCPNFQTFTVRSLKEFASSYGYARPNLMLEGHQNDGDT